MDLLVKEDNIFMGQLVSIILAQADGTMMNSSCDKAFHKICGSTLLDYAIDASKEAGSEAFAIFIRNNIENAELPENSVLLVNEKPCIGQAIFEGLNLCNEGTILVLGVDTPAITGETLKSAYEYHKQQGNLITFLTDKEDTGFQNSEICFLEVQTLSKILSELRNNADETVDLSDIINEAVLRGNKTGAYVVKDTQELLKVNDRKQLNEAEHVILRRIINKHMENGVTFHLPETCMIDKNVKIGRDTVIYPGTILEGETIIGENCVIGPNSRIENGLIGNNVRFENSVMTQSQVGDNTNVGPFAYIRPGSKIGQNVKIGDFVEVKNSNIGDKTKVSHLSYVGDADIGKNVNIGCGGVVVNYDGRKKHRTVVGDNAFIGCNVNLVSPVVVNEHAYIAAGSTITDEVPAYSLAIARSRQTIKENWVREKGLDKK